MKYITRGCILIGLQEKGENISRATSRINAKEEKKKLPSQA